MKEAAPRSWGSIVNGVIAAVFVASWIGLTVQQRMAAPDASAPPATPQAAVAIVQMGDAPAVYARIADTPALRQQGLSGSDPLAADEGMLFLFEAPGTYGFWMKDMRYPIDMLWIRDHALVDITADAAVPVPGEALPTYAPRVAADAVLEVQAGFAARYGLAAGMPVVWEVDRD